MMLATFSAYAPAHRGNTSTIDNRTYLNVTQQPGEDGEQLARRIVQVLHQDYIDVNGLAR